MSQIHTRGNSYRETGYRSSRRIRPNTPSFSSSLLDEIYRSIDAKSEDSEGIPAKKQSSFRGRSEEREEIARYRKACLVEKWIEKEANDRFVARKRVDLENDLSFFSSTSSSSDSSGVLSDSEFFGSTAEHHKVSCFSSLPKPIRTVSDEKTRKQDPSKKNIPEDDLMKSKSRAMKIYTHLKKMKQPISPGGRLTTLINSLFTNVNGGKKTKSIDTDKDSTSSFSRCKYPEESQMNHQRKLRFHQPGIVLDEDSRLCKPPLPPNSKPSRNKGKTTSTIVGLVSDSSKSKIASVKEEAECDLDDAMSDSSSDLFELDHLVLRLGHRKKQQQEVSRGSSGLIR